MQQYVAAVAAVVGLAGRAEGCDCCSVCVLDWVACGVLAYDEGVAFCMLHQAQVGRPDAVPV